ncbi:hypothetical protein TNCV_1665221, partial [Trichonephila clavipes]
SPLVSMKKEKGRRTAADSVQSGWPVYGIQEIMSFSSSSHAVFARRRS